ncbi:segregation/condensation protein A [Candidatus Falkowbacteria bacterium]|jgi:segregation and condensation protein A|nr:segregation/condensation protein A [Candidatus Falkowbacteria bacterium]MBT4433414.1 segregation/condensation protein A [Candidatus Falkowbacteria bacterium]
MLKVKFDQFEGPLDLLLKLIKNEKLDITQISLVHITDQYLSYVGKIEKIAPQEVADFLLVAAKLLHLKSKVLLPEIEDEEDEEDFLKQIKIYKEYLDASKKINKILNKKRFLFSRNSNIKKQVFFSPPKMITTEKIKEVFNDFLARFIKDVDNIEEDKITRRISIQDKIKEINHLIKNKKQFILNYIFNSSTPKEEKVVSFLAVLEIVRKGEVLVGQKELFSEIVVARPVT